MPGHPYDIPERDTRGASEGTSVSLNETQEIAMQATRSINALLQRRHELAAEIDAIEGVLADLSKAADLHRTVEEF